MQGCVGRYFDGEAAFDVGNGSIGCSFSAMLAPISGSPAEVTTPEMVFDWANTELLQATKSNKKTRKRFVLFLVCLLVRISFP